MKTMILLALLMASVSAAPTPANRVKPGKLSETVFLPSAYSALDPYGIPLGAYHQHQFLEAYPVKQIPVKTVDATNQQVQLLLSVPSVVPPGTSVTVTVQVANSQSGTGTTVSLLPTVIQTPGGAQQNIAPPDGDAIIVDANSGSGPSIIDAISVDDLDNREPPVFVNLPFDNPKDSPLLVALQEQAMKQEMLAALARKF